ncbi:MAG: hypothetical protein ABSG31_17105 [Tepidisphaeraceae bacterium]
MAADNHGAKEDERLRPFFVTVFGQVFADRPVYIGVDRAMIERDIHVDAADVLGMGVGKQQFWHPTSDDGHGILVFAQDAHQFQHHHAGGFRGQIGIVDATAYHARSMTLLNRKSAASSPRPRRLKRSK